MKKKILVLGLAGLLLVSAVGCSAKKPPAINKNVSENTENHPMATAGISAKSNAVEMTNKINSIIDKKFPGKWSVNGLQLKKGSYVENDKYEIVDEISKNLNGSMISLYVGENRISNSLKDSTGGRMLDYDIPAEVTKTMQSGKASELSLNGPGGKPYQKFYIPIKQGDKTLGVIGVSMKVK